MNPGYSEDVDYAKWELELAERPWTRIPSQMELTRSDMDEEN